MTPRTLFASLLASTSSTCTTQQYIEGLKAGRNVQRLQYPASEFDSRVDETMLNYHEYRQNVTK